MPRPERPSGRGALRPHALAALLLLALALAGFTVTRAARLDDDVVNTVALSESLTPGAVAEISFVTTDPDARADVLITDTEDRQVRALALGQQLDAGPHRYRWDGTADDGSPVAAGEYGIRVILGEQGRDVKPPGRITVMEDG